MVAAAFSRSIFVLIVFQQRGGLRVALLFFLLARNAAKAMLHVRDVTAAGLAAHDLCIAPRCVQITRAVLVVNRECFRRTAFEGAEWSLRAIQQLQPHNGRLAEALLTP